MKLYKINDEVCINAEQITGLEAKTLREIKGEHWITDYKTVVRLRDGWKIVVNKPIEQVIEELKNL